MTELMKCIDEILAEINDTKFDFREGSLELKEAEVYVAVGAESKQAESALVPRAELTGKILVKTLEVAELEGVDLDKMKKLERALGIELKRFNRLIAPGLLDLSQVLKDLCQRILAFVVDEFVRGWKGRRALLNRFEEATADLFHALLPVISASLEPKPQPAWPELPTAIHTGGGTLKHLKLKFAIVRDL